MLAEPLKVGVRRDEFLTGMLEATIAASVKLRIIGDASLSFNLLGEYTGKELKYYMNRLIERKCLDLSNEPFKIWPKFEELTDEDFTRMAAALPTIAEKAFADAFMD